MDQTIQTLPDHLNAVIIEESDEIVVAALELDGLHSFIGKKSNDQWLWLAMHSKTRQILAFHVGKRTKQAAEHLWIKLPEELKKKPSFIGTNSRFILKLSLLARIDLATSNQVKEVTLKDLIVR